MQVLGASRHTDGTESFHFYKTQVIPQDEKDFNRLFYFSPEFVSKFSS